MGARVTFNYQAWVARYPEFTSVTEPVAQGYFDEATLYCRNDGAGPVPTAAMLSTLLNMLTAHIAAIYSDDAGAPRPANQPPGAVSNATEGSVNVTFKNEYGAGTVQWYQQTKYGSSYWAATKVFRRMKYVGAPCGTLQLPGWNYPELGQ